MSNGKSSLTDSWTGNTDFLVFGPKNPGHGGILKDSIDKIYSPNFPASVGYHDFDMLTAILNDPESAVDCRIIVAGENLRGGGRDPVLKGICISFYYKNSDTAQLTYLAVDPAYRTEGLGFALFKQYEQALLDCAKDNNSILKGHYISCQDPEKEVLESHRFYDTYDPLKRIRKYENWGGRKQDFNYTVAYYFNGRLQLDDYYALLAFKNPELEDAFRAMVAPLAATDASCRPPSFEI